MNRSMLIHIGYHKTASTVLQEHFFNSSLVDFRRWKDDRELISKELVCLPPFKNINETIRKDIEAQMDAANAEGKCFVISHERLSGYYATGGFDSADICRRLSEAFPYAKILIVIREQRSIVESSYSQYITDGGVLPFGRFLQGRKDNLLRSPEFSWSYFEYDHLINLYAKCFGPDAVLTLPFEMLQRSPGEFLRRIGAHCGVDVESGSFSGGFPPTNTRRSIIAQELVRIGNRILLRTQLNPAGLIENLTFRRGYRVFGRGLSKVLSAVTPPALEKTLLSRRRAYIGRLAKDRFEQSNQAVEKLTGLQLAPFGYATDTPAASTQSNQRTDMNGVS